VGFVRIFKSQSQSTKEELVCSPEDGGGGCQFGIAAYAHEDRRWLTKIHWEEETAQRGEAMVRKGELGTRVNLPKAR